MYASEVTDGIYRLAANIDSEVLFEGLWPLPHGASMNSYLVKGDKVALIDGVCDWDGVPETLFKQLEQLELDINDIDTIVINHTEPDHTGWLKAFMEIKKDFEIVTTKSGQALAQAFYDLDVPYRLVKSGDSIDLGQGKQLQFFETPNVHWPDSMVTYEVSTQTLFSCDIFGSYGAINESPYDDQLKEEELAFFEGETSRYYANIVARFATSAVRALDKVADLPIKTIAPGHGIVWRKDPQHIVDIYRRLSSYCKGPAKPMVTVLWGSMYGFSEQAVTPVVAGLEKAGVEVCVHRIPDSHISDVLNSVWQSTGVVLNMPTYEFKMFPPMAAAIDEIGRKMMKGKLALRLGSYGWSGGAQRELDELLELHKLNWTQLDPVEFKGAMNDEEKDLIFQRGLELGQMVKEKALS